MLQRKTKIIYGDRFICFMILAHPRENPNTCQFNSITIFYYFIYELCLDVLISQFLKSYFLSPPSAWSYNIIPCDQNAEIRTLMQRPYHIVLLCNQIPIKVLIYVLPTNVRRHLITFPRTHSFIHLRIDTVPCAPISHDTPLFTIYPPFKASSYDQKWGLGSCNHFRFRKSTLDLSFDITLFNIFSMTPLL